MNWCFFLRYIDEIDGVLGVNSYNGKVEIYLYKKTSDGYVKILTVSSKERGSLQVTKLIGLSNEKFERLYAKKIEKDSGSLRGHNNPNPSTKAQSTDESFSNIKVSQNPNFVKSKLSLGNGNASSKDVFGFAVKEDAKVNEDLLEELSIYHPDAEVDSYSISPHIKRKCR